MTNVTNTFSSPARFEFCFEIVGHSVSFGWDWTAHWMDLIVGKEEGLPFEGFSFELLKFFVRYMNNNAIAERINKE